MCTLRSKGSFSLAFNDHSNLLNGRFERNPLYLPPCCACCSCTSLYTYRVPTCPSLLYGLRQSKLLQWSVYGVERYLSRLPAYGVERYLTSQPVYGVNHGCCEVYSCLRERSVCDGSGRRRQRCVSCCRESDGGSEIDYQVSVDFAEDVLSLLNEGCGGVKRRYGSSFKRLEAGMSRNDGGRERMVSSGRKLQEKKKGDIASELNEVKRKLAELESDLKRHQTVRRIVRRERNGEGNNQQEMLAKRENHKRGDVSSRSSFYSGSSLEDFSSDVEIEDKYTQIEEELSMEHENDRGREGRVMGKVLEESTRLRDYSKRLGESLDQKNIKAQGDVSLDSRNYRENKIAAKQEMQSRAGPSQKNLEVLRSHEIAGQKSSISCMKFNSQENNYSKTTNLDDRRGRQYNDNEVPGASALPRFKTTETPELHAGYVNMPSRLKKTHLGREEEVKTSKTSMQETNNYLKRRVPKEDDLYVHSVKLISEVEEINKTSHLSKQQDIRRMKLGESQISVQRTDEQLHQSGELITTCRNDKSTSETLESSQIRESHIRHTNATKTNITNQKMETKINLVSGSSSEAKEMGFEKTERKPRRVQSHGETKVENDMSYLQGTGAERVTFWRASDEGSMSQHTNSTSFKSFVEIRDSKCQTDENMTQFGSQHVAQPTKVSISSQNSFEEVSGLQGSLHSSTEVRMKQRKREESDRRNIQEMVRRPSLMPARASAQAEPTTRISSSDVCHETSEGGASALSMHSGKTTAFQSEMNSGDGSGWTYHETLNTTTPEDSLGSADQLEKLSSQCIGEFVVKVGSEMQSAIEAGFCGGSGTKGPSDLMRDVRQPSVFSTQRLARGSAHGVPTAMTMSLDSNTGTSESSSSAGCMHSGSTTAFQSGTSGGGGSFQTYHEPFSTADPEDSLGSAYHLEKLSSKFIGEFVEKVKHEDTISEVHRQAEDSELHLAVEVDRLWETSNRINPEDSLRSTDDGLEKLSSQYVSELDDRVTHEVTISGTQREIEGSELNQAAEVGTYWKNSSSQHVSQEGIQFQLSSSHSSGGSGTEGPSILIEDLKEPSVPSSQQPARGSVQGVPTTKITSPKVSCDTSESSCTALVRHSGRSTALQPETYNPDESGQTYLEPLKTINPEDPLYKAKSEVTLSRTQGETKASELQTHDEIDKSRNNSKNQYDIQEGSQFELASSHSSGDSGLKGPSDIMWDVREPSVQETSKSEPMDAAPNEKAVIRRTGRTFWSIIADVFRLRWGLRADAPNLTGRSDERSSSDKSASTEASSSGNEHEDNVKNSVRNEKTVPPGSSTSDQLQLRKRFSQSEEKVSETVGSKEMKSPAIMMSSGTLVSSSVPEDVSSQKVALSLTEKVKSSEGFSTNKEILELSPPLQVFHVVEESVVGCSELSKLKSTEQTGQSISLPETELAGARKKEAELKRRKLQRTKQVARDRFDDWEEAYKLELEQKIIDEMFMREALLEATKAADAWEVPVGAVLVQHGKIISRGCNLVEELRDSTAHAEMICIREASNLLRTWRLSETTLYVTLEPCPMCAGAILQARIDAVVWGAPNKLLGADGSWVRLFPDEVDDSESRDKPAAPIHPFHPKMKIRRGVLASECADMMQQFFQLRRKKKKAEPSTSQPSLPGSHNPAKILAKMHDIFHFTFCL